MTNNYVSRPIVIIFITYFVAKAELMLQLRMWSFGDVADDVQAPIDRMKHLMERVWGLMLMTKCEAM